MTSTADFAVSFAPGRNGLDNQARAAAAGVIRRE